MARPREQKPLWHLSLIPVIGGALIGLLIYAASHVETTGAGAPTKEERKAIEAATTCAELERLSDRIAAGDPLAYDVPGVIAERARALHCTLGPPAD